MFQKLSPSTYLKTTVFRWEAFEEQGWSQASRKVTQGRAHWSLASCVGGNWESGQLYSSHSQHPPGPQTIQGWCPVTPSKQALWSQKPFLPWKLEVLGKVMTGIIFKNLGRSPHSSTSLTYHLHLASITCGAWISWESLSQAPSRGQYTC